MVLFANKIKFLIKNRGGFTALFCALFFISCNKSATLENVRDNNTVQENFSQIENTVFVFFSPECPMSLEYIPLLNKIKQNFISKIECKAIVSGNYYSKELIKSVADSLGFEWSLYLDIKYSVAQNYKAIVTPEVVVVDKKGIVLYQGAIDDKLTELGRKKNAATEFYLLNALESLVEGKKPKVQKTVAAGCLIESN